MEAMGRENITKTMKCIQLKQNVIYARTLFSIGYKIYYYVAVIWFAVLR